MRFDLKVYKGVLLMGVIANIFGSIAYASFSDLFQEQNSIPLNQGRWDFTPNPPELSTGMNPVYWNGTTEIPKYLNSSLNQLNPNWVEEDWYVYRNTRDGVFDNKWANMKTLDGSFWVWIPRFVYVVRTGFHSSLTGTLDVSFVEGTNDETFYQNLNPSTLATAANDTWTSHPAFTIGTTQLEGFWVAKFLASRNNNIPRFVPGATTWSEITVDTAFSEGRSIENESTVGLSSSAVETMLIRNDQFVALSILAFSKYGRNNSLTNTPNNNGISGGGTGNFWTTQTAFNENSTFNIHGVYDLGGGEYVPAYINRPGLPNSSVTLSYNASPNRFAHRFNGYNDTLNFKGHGFWEFAPGTATRSFAQGDGEFNVTEGAASWGNPQANFPGYSNNVGTGGFYRDYVFRVGQFGFSQALNYAYTTLRFRASIVVL